MTQSEAKKFCEEEQEVPARLVEIDSAEEDRAIFAEIQRSNFFSRKIYFWLGITDRHSEGHWVLESTGKSVVFTNWHSGEPNNSGSDENCAHTIHHNWNDRKCSDKQGYGWMRTALCEKWKSKKEIWNIINVSPPWQFNKNSILFCRKLRICCVLLNS